MEGGNRAPRFERTACCGLLLAGLALSLFLCEVLVRLAGVAPDVVMIRRGRFQLAANPRIGWEPAPGIDYRGNSLDFYDYRGAGNSLGYRDYEHPLEKQQGAYRILVLGDSIGAGLYIQDRAQVFPAILESLLLKEGVPAEVINLSVSGYNTRQEVEILRERGLRYDPDLVILAYCLNDVALDDGGIMEALLDLEADSPGIPRARVTERWLLRSALYRFLSYVALAPGSTESSRRRDRYRRAISEDTSEEALRDLGELQRENGFQVLVALFPELRNLADYGYMERHERVARLSGEIGFRHLDLLETFKFCEAMTDGEIGFDRYHPTPDGHLCAADAISAFILERVMPNPSTARALR